MLIKSTLMLRNDPVAFEMGWLYGSFLSSLRVCWEMHPTGVICVGSQVRVGSFEGSWLGDFVQISSTSGSGGGRLHITMHTFYHISTVLFYSFFLQNLFLRVSNLNSEQSNSSILYFISL